MLTMPKNLPQPQLKPNTEVVLQKRYLRKDMAGRQTETPRDAVSGQKGLSAQGGLSVRGAHTEKCMTQTESPPDAVSGQKDLSA